MKKRCTNSACRRVFSLAQVAETACPYCGKAYPRLGRTGLVDVVLTGWNPERRVIWGVGPIHRHFDDISLRQCRQMVIQLETNPITVATQVRAKALRTAEEWRAYGFRVTLSPAKP